jgi:hypothetical protein
MGGKSDADEITRTAHRLVFAEEQIKSGINLLIFRQLAQGIPNNLENRRDPNCRLLNSQ